MINCLPAATYFTSDPRADGWTPEREVGFLLCLAETGLVTAACRAVGMGVSGAYALRRRGDGFAFNLAWEAATLLARQRLLDDLLARALEGEETVSTRVDGTTTRRAQNYRLGIGMLDKLASIEMGRSAQLIAQDFEAFLFIIAEGSVPATVRDFFMARTGSMEFREINQTLPLAEKTAENSVAANDNAGSDTAELDVWMKDDAEDDYPEWETNFPPPADFDGDEIGAFGCREYRRDLSDEERAVMIDEYYEVPEISPEQLANAAAARDARFGFRHDSAGDALEIKSIAGLRRPRRAALV